MSPTSSSSLSEDKEVNPHGDDTRVQLDASSSLVSARRAPSSPPEPATEPACEASRLMKTSSGLEKPVSDPFSGSTIKDADAANGDVPAAAGAAAAPWAADVAQFESEEGIVDLVVVAAAAPWVDEKTKVGGRGGLLLVSSAPYAGDGSVENELLCSRFAAAGGPSETRPTGNDDTASDLGTIWPRSKSAGRTFSSSKEEGSTKDAALPPPPPPPPRAAGSSSSSSKWRSGLWSSVSARVWVVEEERAGERPGEGERTVASFFDWSSSSSSTVAASSYSEAVTSPRT